jgi:hypothetical protein
MRISTISTVRVLELIAISSSLTVGFSPHHQGSCRRYGRIVDRHHLLVRLNAEKTESDGSSVATMSKKVQEIGLLTFDLDDTLYPIAPVVDDANGELHFFFIEDDDEEEEEDDVSMILSISSLDSSTQIM